ncbi:MAG: dephospho-CoA kinase [Thermotogae bacterium]|nr:dephospho-CoA kinase [Thermotogota bacterium]
MLVIGITGRMASGKSTISNFFKEKGVVVIDLDKVGHMLLSTDNEIIDKVISTFGKEVWDGKKIDRQKLGKIVFANESKVKKLNAVMHPKMKRVVVDILNRLNEMKIEVVVIEGVLLVEIGLIELVDFVIVADADEEIEVKRVQQRDGLATDEVKKRLSLQMSRKAFFRIADWVVDTTGPFEVTKVRMDEIWRKIRQML